MVPYKNKKSKSRHEAIYNAQEHIGGRSSKYIKNVMSIPNYMREKNQSSS